MSATCVPSLKERKVLRCPPLPYHICRTLRPAPIGNKSGEAMRFD
jgi:hypothetical protein